MTLSYFSPSGQANQPDSSAKPTDAKDAPLGRSAKSQRFEWVYIFAPSVIRTLVIDQQIFEVLEEPFVWYETPEQVASWPTGLLMQNRSLVHLSVIILADRVYTCRPFTGVIDVTSCCSIVLGNL
jgi:hypothetical protein